MVSTLEAGLMSVGKRLKKWRKDKGWSLRRLELETERLGHKVSNSYISQIENEDIHRPNPSQATLEVLATALGKTLADLYAGDSVAECSVTVEPYSVLGRIEALAIASGSSLRQLLSEVGVTVDALVYMDPGRPDPNVLWPIAQRLGTSMVYLLGETSDHLPIVESGQAASNADAIYKARQLSPEQVLDLERAFLEVERRRQPERQNDIPHN